MPGDFEVSFGGVVHGFHVYQAVWNLVIGEELSVAVAITNARPWSHVYSL